jgi:transposase
MAKDKRDRHVQGHKKMKEEGPEQKHAFETYFLMGDDRSYRKLAKQMNKAPSTITNWAKWFNWQERIDERDAQVDTIVQERNNKTMAEIKLEQARQIDAVMNVFWQKVNKGKMELDSWMDYERLWKIRQEIGGEGERKRSNALADLTDSIARVAQTIKGGQ